MYIPDFWMAPAKKKEIQHYFYSNKKLFWSFKSLFLEGQK
jgi:hypothetical protein